MEVVGGVLHYFPGILSPEHCCPQSLDPRQMTFLSLFVPPSASPLCPLYHAKKKVKMESMLALKLKLLSRMIPKSY
ncbi:hypothetical protein SKAU_G00311920 [Synaphobranchus kaupii]|uniref:Uncharacterized protein n=1 Tax=Synaphobranchus kaupii TaxID=118154 RepID=A0A9Q1ES13_SYNKA|nr:hypothetical protein SKAU_G00311920 [Synaphobranchus kaupii]